MASCQHPSAMRIEDRTKTVVESEFNCNGDDGASGLGLIAMIKSHCGIWVSDLDCASGK